MPIRSLGLSDESSMQLDRYVKEKVIAVVSKEINKDEWGDDPILLLKSYQNQMRADIKDLWIQWDRHTEEINKIKKRITSEVLTSLELSDDPIRVLEARISRLERRIPNKEQEALTLLDTKLWELEVKVQKLLEAKEQ
jgi:hypothetical protein